MTVKLAFEREDLNRLRQVMEARCAYVDGMAYDLEAEDDDRRYWLYEHGEAVKLLRKLEAAAAQLTRQQAKEAKRESLYF